MPCSCGNNFNTVPKFDSSSFVHLEKESSVVSQAEILSRVLSDEPLSLCLECVERLSKVLEEDVERIQSEEDAYRVELRESQERSRLLVRTVRSSMIPSQAAETVGEQRTLGLDEVDRTEATFRAEIYELKQEVAQQEQELKHLESLKKEQEEISRQLDEVEDADTHNRNNLQISARALNYTQEKLAKSLLEAQEEVDKLVSVQLHSVLFDLVIDERGLRYPLINELRLAFSPKGDLHWDEIQTAWAQVAQKCLLMSLTFPVADWRIIPLSGCAKLINKQKQTVFNLGKDIIHMANGLRSLNCYLHDLFRSMMAKMRNEPLPFPMSQMKIGDLDLTQVPNTDDPRWSKVIHLLACNLDHISEMASRFEQRLWRSLLV